MKDMSCIIVFMKCFVDVIRNVVLKNSLFLEQNDQEKFELKEWFNRKFEGIFEKVRVKRV